MDMAKLSEILWRIKKEYKDQKGTTMVELIVSFLLLGIFLTAVSIVISNATGTYYREKQQLSEFTVADTVLAELRGEIRSMQASGLGGFVRIKNGAAWQSAAVGTPCGGDMIEFIRSNEKDGLILMQMDAGGCADGTVMIDSERVQKSADELQAAIPKDRLTCRYYLRAEETQDEYRGLFVDVLKEDSTMAAKSGLAPARGKPVVWDVESRLPESLYQDRNIRLYFSVTPFDDNGNAAVGSVDVTVEVLKKAEPDSESAPQVVYRKAGTIPLQNTVYYRNEAVLYSEK